MKYQGPPIFYALIGLPRSGTSIINRVLHNVENGFCISEPLHRIGWEKAQTAQPFDKIGPLGIDSYSKIIPAIHQYWINPFGPWQIGGIKEVDVFNGKIGDGFTRWGELFKHKKLFIPVFVERDPIMIFDAWQRSEFKTRGLDKFVKTWQYLEGLKTVGNSPFGTINYERFTANPIKELNQAFAPGSFSGRVSLEPITGAMGPMDNGAKRSITIKKAKTAHSLPKYTVDLIKNHCK